MNNSTTPTSSFMLASAILGGEHYVLRSSLHPSVRCPLTSMSRDAISLPLINGFHVSWSLWKGLQGQRSKVKVIRRQNSLLLLSDNGYRPSVIRLTEASIPIDIVASWFTYRVVQRLFAQRTGIFRLQRQQFVLGIEQLVSSSLKQLTRLDSPTCRRPSMTCERTLNKLCARGEMNPGNWTPFALTTCEAEIS